MFKCYYAQCCQLTNGRHITLFELAIHVSTQQTRLADARIADQQDLERCSALDGLLLSSHMGLGCFGHYLHGL